MWAVDSRNQLKAEIRAVGNPITRKLAEDRNQEHYGDPLGPSYTTLAQELQAEGVPPEQIDAEIIAGAGRSNATVNAWLINSSPAAGARLEKRCSPVTSYLSRVRCPQRAT